VLPEPKKKLNKNKHILAHTLTYTHLLNRLTHKCVKKYQHTECQRLIKKIKIKAKEWLGTRELTHKRIKTNNE